SMLPMTVANVLVGSLLAKQDFRAVPWFIVIAAGYGAALRFFLIGSSGIEPFTVFKGVILRLGIFSTLMLLVALAFSLWPKKPGGLKA
ncbi:MAG TPA: hypothetical protein VK633_11580, partial [Verrucomicrobiae bacterium]|nr:hypothetical protein [Verrucomicrobiae bacterium]